MDRREYFVEMTTHVPEGTHEQTVDDIREREAARAGELRQRDTSSGCGVHRWHPANGGRSVCSAPTTTAS